MLPVIGDLILVAILGAIGVTYFSKNGWSACASIIASLVLTTIGLGLNGLVRDVYGSNPSDPASDFIYARGKAGIEQIKLIYVGWTFASEVRELNETGDLKAAAAKVLTERRDKLDKEVRDLLSLNDQLDVLERKQKDDDASVAQRKAAIMREAARINSEQAASNEGERQLKSTSARLDERRKELARQSEGQVRRLSEIEKAESSLNLQDKRLQERQAVIDAENARQAKTAKELTDQETDLEKRRRQHLAAEHCDSKFAADWDLDKPISTPGVSFDRAKITSFDVSQCEAAASFYPQNARIQFQLGRAYYAIRNLEAAKATYEVAASLGSGAAYVNLGALYSQGEIGTSKNYAVACGYYKLGAALGNPKGKEYYFTCRTRLSGV